MTVTESAKHPLAFTLTDKNVFLKSGPVQALQLRRRNAKTATPGMSSDKFKFALPTLGGYLSLVKKNYRVFCAC